MKRVWFESLQFHLWTDSVLGWVWLELEDSYNYNSIDFCLE